MATARVVERVDLDNHVAALQDTAEQPFFRTTQTALQYELQEQQLAREEAAWITESISPQHQELLEDLQNIQKDVSENIDGLDYLMGITELENLYSNISALTANRAFDLSMKGMDPAYAVHDLCPEVDGAWENVQRYSEIANVHLKHASDYHKYYYQTKQLNTRISQTREQIKNLFDDDNWEFCEGVPSEAKKLRYILKKSLDEFEYYSREVENLASQAQMVVPICMRFQPIETAVEGIMLCDYDAGDYMFRTGDRVIVLSNQVSSSTNLFRNIIERFPNVSDTQIVHDSDEEKSVSSGGTVEIIDIPENGDHGQSSDSHRQSLFDSRSVLSGTVDTGFGTSSFWRVRGLGSNAERNVPGVCIWITESDVDATTTASRYAYYVISLFLIALQNILNIYKMYRCVQLSNNQTG